MADERSTYIKISDMTPASNVPPLALFEVSNPGGDGYSTNSATPTLIGRTIVKDVEYADLLNTNSSTIVGALNELKAESGEGTGKILKVAIPTSNYGAAFNSIIDAYNNNIPVFAYHMDCNAFITNIATESLSNNQIRYHIYGVSGGYNVASLGNDIKSVYLSVVKTADGTFKSFSSGSVKALSTDTTQLAIGSECEAGEYAVATGDNSIASGKCSHAEGGGAHATGEYSHAEGAGTYATEHGAHAEGSGNTASGENAHAEGAGGQATGYASHVEGMSSEASGAQAHAEGYQTQATGAYTHAEGNSTIAAGVYSHAEGESSEAHGLKSHAEGGGTIAYGMHGHSEGAGNVVSGTSAHVEGAGNVASGNGSHAEGEGGRAIGARSHVEGAGNKAFSDASHAEGMGNRIIGYGPSHVEGAGVVVSIHNGGFAHGEGQGVHVTGSGAHGEGTGCSAIGQASHSEGAGVHVWGDQAHGEGGGHQVRGYSSHAEGEDTLTVGWASHTEGLGDTYRKYTYNGTITIKLNAISSSTTSDGIETIVTEGGVKVDSTTGTTPAHIECWMDETKTGKQYNGKVGQLRHPYAKFTKLDATVVSRNLINPNASHMTTKDIFFLHYGKNPSDFESIPENDTTPYGYSAFVLTTSVYSTITSLVVNLGAAAYQLDNFDINKQYVIPVYAYDEFVIPGSHTVDPTFDVNRTAALSDGAHAEGVITRAIGTGSHSQGIGTLAKDDGQMATGKFNLETDNMAMVVGNGTVDFANNSATRSNCHTLDWNGNAWYSGDIYVGSTSGTNKDGGSKKVVVNGDNSITVGSTTITESQLKALLALLN